MARELHGEDQLVAMAREIHGEDQLVAMARELHGEDQLVAMARELHGEDQLVAMAKRITYGEDQLVAMAKRITYGEDQLVLWLCFPFCKVSGNASLISFLLEYIYTSCSNWMEFPATERTNVNVGGAVWLMA